MLELSGTEVIHELSLAETSAEQSAAIDVGGELVGVELVDGECGGGEVVGARSWPLVQPTVAKSSVTTPRAASRTEG